MTVRDQAAAPAKTDVMALHRVEQNFYDCPAQEHQDNLGFSMEEAALCLSLSLKGQWVRKHAVLVFPVLL